MRRLLILAAALSCGGGQTTGQGGAAAAPAADPAAEREFKRHADTFYTAHLDFRPHFAIGLGLHEYDGRVPDRSAAAIAAEVERLKAAREWLQKVDVAGLSATSRLDREILLAEVQRRYFDLAVLRRPFRQPLYYLLFDFSLAPYVDRNYAPLEQRARALLKACQSAPGYYRQMMANLKPPLAKPALQIGIMMLGGTIKFVDGDLRNYMKPLRDKKLQQQVNGCVDQLVPTLEKTRADLEKLMPSATNDFALGEKRFLEMLSATQGFDVDLVKLRAIAKADLEQNLRALHAAAKKLYPELRPKYVIEKVGKDKPSAIGVLGLATEQAKKMRQFVIDKEIASIPSDDPVQVRRSPPHLRGNFAALNSAGALEKKSLPSFYYIAPPDPSWPGMQQRAYLPSRWDLLFVTIHEVWPGHFLQGRHIKQSSSRYLKSFETYSTSEGWAHYVEEMMWEAGVGDGDPRVQIGMLKNALLRNVRFLVSIDLHTGGMTVNQATQMFRRHAFADKQNARQQALRGTADPMYLSYTLGKLAIRKLHKDWRKAKGDGYSLKAFHDEFLRHGEAPLPVIRRSMLGPNAGPVL